MLKNKKGLVFGIANNHSIAWGIAKQLAKNDAEIAIGYQNEILLKRVKPLSEEINSKIDELNVNDEFESSLEDNLGKKIKFIFVENFKAENGQNCKKISFNEPLMLSNIDRPGTNVTLDVCKINDNYELSSINLSK